MKKIIQYKELKIGLKTNDELLYRNLLKDYNNIFEFKEYNELDFNIININICKDFKVYNKYLYKLKEERKRRDVYIYRNEIIIIIDNDKTRVFIVYDKLTYNKLGDIENVIINIFKILFKKDGFFLLRAAVVSLENNGILILEENVGDRIPILFRVTRRRI